jgi:aryl-alcohol dehydrogenase-like predicted oxidoreductase
MSLPKAPLGRNGPMVNRLGFGLMGLSAFYGDPKPDTERLALLSQAHELGQHNWDSSDLCVPTTRLCLLLRLSN